MEQRKQKGQIKISFKTAIIFIILLVLLIAIILGVTFVIIQNNSKENAYQNSNNKENTCQNNNTREEVNQNMNSLSFDMIKKHSEDWMRMAKPIIYLYPEETSKIEVKLGLPEKITCSYPQYTNSGWKVQAETNGDLVDLSTQRNLYSLYYESENVIPFKVEDTGFVVKGSDSAKFLEEKLAILGLTEREAEEFIIYWLPKLEKNNYNYIRFATPEEINKNMPLTIEPNPDTTIRVLMTFKGLNEPIDVKEQKLTTPERKGFVAVEWGGTEIQ